MTRRTGMRGVLGLLLLVSTTCWCSTIEAKPNLGKKLLESAQRGDTAQVLALLAQGADARYVDRDSCTALMVAAGGCPRDVGSASVDMVKALLGAGADPNRPHPEGGTLLIHAAFYDHAEIARALLDAHADPNVRDPGGRTALFFAAHGNAELVRLLLDRGATVNLKQMDGTSPLQNAASTGQLEVVQLLLNGGADPSSADDHGQTCFMTAAYYGAVDVLEALRDAKADMGARDEAGNTALMNAAYAGKLNACKWLLEHGADRNAQNKQGRTAFTYARDGGHKYLAHLLEPGGGAEQSQAAGGAGPFDGRAWTVGDTSSNGESEITEYVLPLESVHAWTELVTVQRFPELAKKMKTSQLMEIVRKSTLDLCPSTTWAVVRQGEDEVLYQWWHQGCEGHDDQLEVAKLYRDGSALTRIAWVTRDVSANLETRATWLRVVGEYRAEAKTPSH